MSIRKLIILSIALAAVLSAFSQEIKPVSGVVDLRSWDFLDSPKISLDGEWNFYWNELLDFQQAEKKASTPITFSIPWSEQVGMQLPPQGYATYALQIYLPREAPPLAMEVPAFYNSYQLFVNGKMISKNGTVGIDLNSSSPYWRSHLASIETDQDTLNVVLHISNFHHNRGGANLPIHLGSYDVLGRRASISDAVTKILCLILLGMSIFSLFNRANRKAALYFSALCFSWMVRSLFSNQYLFHEFIEVSWMWAVRIEYLSIFLTVIYGALYIGTLYRSDTPIILKYFLVIANSAFIFIILISTPAIFSKYIWIILAVALITVLFAFFVVLKALVYDRAGAWFSVSSFLLMATVFGYNIVAYLENFDVNVIALYSGFLVSFALNGYALYYQATHNDKNDTLTFEQLYGKKN
jgi:hypothetical protein